MRASMDFPVRTYGGVHSLGASISACSRPISRRLPTTTKRRSVTARAASPQLWTSYCKNLEERPVVTKSLTSLIGFMLGDMLAQDFEGAASFDLMRVSRLGLYGLIFDGPIGHRWYRWLDGKCDTIFENPRGAAAIAVKTSADQLIWAPVMTCVFFAFLKLLEGHPELMLPTIQDKVLKTVVANYCIWPAAHIISFKFVPSEQRVLYNNVIAIAWNCYLSLVAQDGVVVDSDGAAMGLQQFADLFSQESLTSSVESSLRVLKNAGAISPEQLDSISRALSDSIVNAIDAVDSAAAAVGDLVPDEEFAQQWQMLADSVDRAIPDEMHDRLALISEKLQQSLPDKVPVSPTRRIVD